MSRINTNVMSLLGQRVLGQNNGMLGQSLERLSTGLRINRGKDDPAGLIASQNLRAEMKGLDQAIKNAERADQVVNITEGGLGEVSSLLNELQALITQTANTGGLSTEELEANQLQIDSILQTIDRIAGATAFQGKKLLNGNIDYQTTNISDQIGAFKVNGAKLGFNETRDVDVLVTASAQIAGLLLEFGATTIDLGEASGGGTEAPNASLVLEIAGNEGARQLSFSSSTSVANIRDAINSFSDVTGVRAVVSANNTSIRLESTQFGTEEFVSLKVIDSGGIDTGTDIGVYTLNATNTQAADPGSRVTFASLNNGITDFGQDVRATINGIVATTKGTRVSINTDFLDVSINLNYDITGGGSGAAQLGSINAMRILGGGADFQLASRVNIAGKVSLGVSNVAARELGRTDYTTGSGTSTYFLSDMVGGKDLNVINGDLTAAQKVVDTAIRDVSTLRGRLGAFQQNVIGATIRSVGISLENTTAAESMIRDADFASETAELTRSQILVTSATQILGIANTQPQSALQLLG
jgi:flagellin